MSFRRAREAKSSEIEPETSLTFGGVVVASIAALDPIAGGAVL